MDKNFQRVYDLISINKQMATQLIKPFEADGKVTEISRLTGGKRTTNYKVRLAPSNIDVVLRIYPQNDSICHKELAVQKRLQNIIPIPEVYYLSTDKETIDFSYAIIEYFDGVTLDRYIEQQQQFPTALAEEIGEILGHLHSIEFPKEGILNCELHLEAGLPPILTWYDYFLHDLAGQRLGKELCNRIAKIVKSSEKQLLQMTDKFVFTHADFRPENIMIKDSKLQGILDWEFALSAPRYFDIGQFLRNEEYLIDRAPANFIKGYQRSAKYNIPANWRYLAKLMDLATMMSFINAKPEKPQLYANMISHIACTVDFLVG